MEKIIISRPQSRRIKGEALESARRVAPEQAVTCFNKAKSQQMEKQYQKALDNYVKATIYNSNYFQAYCNMGSCYRSLGKYYEAKNCYIRAISLSKNDTISHYNLANLYRIIGNYEQSIKHYEIAIDLLEKGSDKGELYINSLVNLGICYKNLGLLEEAIAIYEKANKINQQDQGALYNQAMCILALIESSPSRAFAFVNRERADKANLLFDRAEKLNPSNKMIKLAKIKLNVLAAHKMQAGISAKEELDILLLDPNFAFLAKQISDLISFCEGFNSFLAKSAKRVQCFQLPSRSNSEIQSSFPDIFFSLQGPSLIDLEKSGNSSITENEGIRLIKNHNYKQVEQRIKNLDDSDLLKRSLQMMIYLNKGEFNSKYYEKAYEIFQKYLNKTSKGQKIPFELLTEETHKAIGQVLNYKKNYQESARHFQYVAEQINKRKETIASEHHILGEGFEAAGSMERALEEYRRAFELQPSNQIMSYNLGCCLFDNGHYAQATKYFNIFLQIINSKVDIPSDQKQLYEAECFILIALSSQSGPNDLQLYRKAYDKLITLRNKNGKAEFQEQHMMSFFISFSDLLEEVFFKLKPASKQYSQARDQLISVYENLLSFNNCPDKQQLLQSAGNLSYESKQFLKARNFYKEIINPILIPYGKIALCYLRLFEPAMTLKYIQQDAKINKNNPISEFNLAIIEWIYYNENEGQWGSRLPKVREDLFYQRNIYGIGLIEKLQRKISEIGQEDTILVRSAIEQLLKNPDKYQLQTQFEQLKFKKVKQFMQRNAPKPFQNKRDLIPSDILRLCFTKSADLSTDLHKLFDFLGSMSSYGFQTKIIEALIYLFSYYNYVQSHEINELMIAKTRIQRKIIVVNLDKLIDGDETTFEILPDFSSAKKLVPLARQWEEVLTPKLSLLIATIQKLYYQGNIRQALELQYNFPRHTQFMLCDQTFAKLMIIFHKIVPFDKRVTCKGQNIIEMKKDLINSYESYFNQYIKRTKLPPIALSEDFTPLTIYSTYNSKQQAEQLISSLMKFSSEKVFRPSECEQYTIIINKLVRLRCRWRDPLSSQTILSQVLQNIIENPLDVVNQSVIALQKLLEIVCQYSSQGEKYIKLDSTLKF